MGIILIISIRMWIHFFPVEPIPEYVEPVVEEKVVRKTPHHNLSQNISKCKNQHPCQNQKYTNVTKESIVVK